MAVLTPERANPPNTPNKPRTRLRQLVNTEGVAGWLFTAPVLIGLFVFLILPIILAFWVSFRDWNGLNPPLDSNYVGLDNYRALLTEPGVTRSDFGLSLRNNAYYVFGVVPAQTAIAFFLAVILNQKFLKGKGFFRSAFYFPSITSSIAISLIFIFLFQRNGAINAFLGTVLPVDDLNWLDNADGVIHNFLTIFGVDSAPAWASDHEFLGVSFWQWLSGPSVTMLAIMILATWTTTGTFMLIFLAGLQNIPVEVEEAAIMDGTTAWQRFRRVTLPMMKPTLFLVLTLGLVGTWQVFDQIFAISAGGPQKTTLTPAFLVFREGFRNFGGGRAAAVAFILFAIIIVFTLFQRWVVKPDEL